MTVFTSRQFNQEASRAKREASDGPVFITDRGRPAHVLMTMEAYQRLTGAGAGSIAERLAYHGPDTDEFDIPKLGELFRPAELD